MQVLSEAMLASFKPNTDLAKVEFNTTVAQELPINLAGFAGLFIDKPMPEAPFSADVHSEPDTHEAILEKMGVPLVKEMVDVPVLEIEIAAPLEITPVFVKPRDVAFVQIAPASVNEHQNLHADTTPQALHVSRTNNSVPEIAIEIDEKPVLSHAPKVPQLISNGHTNPPDSEGIKIDSNGSARFSYFSVYPVPLANPRQVEGLATKASRQTLTAPMQLQVERHVTEALGPATAIGQSRDVVNQPDHVTTRTTSVEHQIIAQVSEKLSMLKDKTLEIQLAPKELGKVVFSVTTAESGSVTVAISTEREDVSHLMRRHIEEFAREFQRLGFGQVSFSFSEQSQNRTSSPQDSEDKATAPLSELEDIQPTLMTMSTGVDIRL